MMEYFQYVEKLDFMIFRERIFEEERILHALNMMLGGLED